MRFRILLLWQFIALLHISLLSTNLVSAQERLSFADRDEAFRLDALVDSVADGDLPGGDAWLKWSHHAFRTMDGLIYVPFTLVIEEAPDAFASISMYVRVANLGETSRAGKERSKRRNYTEFEPGEVPVFVPERATNALTPFITQLAGEHSAVLRLAHDQAVYDESRYPFENIHFIDFRASDAAEPYRVQRAVAVPPGDYDVYVAVREYRRSGQQPSKPKVAVMKRTLRVPAFSTTELDTSSIVVAEDILQLPSPFNSVDQSSHPYAFGIAEIVPMEHHFLSGDDNLSVVFFVYNVALDAQRKPNITVGYRFFEQAAVSEVFFSQTAPVEFNSSTLPEQFDIQALNDQLFVSQAVALQSFSEGAYRLEIVVTDNIASRTIVKNVRFVVTPPHNRQP